MPNPPSGRNKWQTRQISERARIRCVRCIRIHISAFLACLWLKEHMKTDVADGYRQPTTIVHSQLVSFDRDPALWHTQDFSG